MRRALALATATAAWVLVIQVASIAMAPPVVVELAPVDVAGITGSNTVDEAIELTLSPSNPALILEPGPSTSPTTTTTQNFPLVTVAPTTTTTFAASTTTTTASAPTTTTAAPVTTTAAPVVTTAPPVTTTTAAPATTTTTAATVVGSFSAPAESEFLSKINGLRSSVGVAGLASNAELNNYARWWAKQMADSGNFAHSDIASLLNPWSVVGENIGYGPTVTSVFNALVASTLHYNNMVDTRFTSVGIGAYVDATGRIWTAHVFGG